MTRRDEIERELGKCVGPASSAVQIAYRCTLAIIEAIEAARDSNVGDELPVEYGAIDDGRHLWYTREWGNIWVGCHHGTPSSGCNPTRICVDCFQGALTQARRGDSLQETES